MVEIFKIKFHSNQDPRDQYPSERRYSASIVLGLSVVFLFLFTFTTLMGTVIIHKISLYKNGAFNSSEQIPPTNLSIEEDLSEENLSVSIIEKNNQQRFADKVGRDLLFNDGMHYNLNIPAFICVGCFIMALGQLLSAITGFIAWKKWYIDHNITIFFLVSSFSILTSAIMLLLIVLNALNSNITEYYLVLSPVGLNLTIFILLLSIKSLLWSLLSSKVAFKGMKNSYPDDIVLSKGGRVQVSTVTKGNVNKGSTVPPEVLSKFSAGNKLAKYLPKKEDNSLPKAENNYEYQQRVNKFLAGNAGETDKF